MKFIHLSDAGLGINTECGTPWEKDRQREIRQSLKNVMEKAADLGVRLVLISGGLFAHQPEAWELDEVNSLFADYPGIEVVIAAGQSDIIRKNAAVRSFVWADNVHYVQNGHGELVELEDLGTVVFAKSVTDFSNGDIFELCRLTTQQDIDSLKTRILLCAESSEEIAERAVTGTFLTYAALGGRKGHLELIRRTAYYAGGLEPAGLDDTGEHGIYLGEVNAHGALMSLKFIPMASTSYVSFTINIDEKQSSSEIRDRIESEIRRYGERNIFTLTLRGKRNPDAMPDLSILRARYRITEIIDETEPVYDFSELFMEHSQDMIGYYISRMMKQQKEMSPLEKKAMYYGIDALLKTAGGREEKH